MVDKNYKKSLSNLENKIGDKNVSGVGGCKVTSIIHIDPKQKDQGEPQVCQRQIFD